MKLKLTFQWSWSLPTLHCTESWPTFPRSSQAGQSAAAALVFWSLSFHRQPHLSFSSQNCVNSRVWCGESHHRHNKHKLQHQGKLLIGTAHENVQLGEQHQVYQGCSHHMNFHYEIESISSTSFSLLTQVPPHDGGQVLHLLQLATGVRGHQSASKMELHWF